MLVLLVKTMNGSFGIPSIQEKIIIIIISVTAPRAVLNFLFRGRELVLVNPDNAVEKSAVMVNYHLFKIIQEL